MKSNKRALEKEAKKEKAKAPKVHVEEVPRFSLGDKVLYFMETSTHVESGIVVGIFVQPGDIVKNYIYQIEHSFTDDKKVERVGLAMPKSEDVLGDVDSCTPAFNSEKQKFTKRFKTLGIKKLNDKIKEYKDSFVIAGNNIKEQEKYQKDVVKIIASLNKRRKEIIVS